MPVATALGVLHRFGDGPVISARPGRDIGMSVSGPSLVAVPGNGAGGYSAFKLYFAHHRGRSIRLAAAQALGGPWQLEKPVLHLRATPYTDHIASPNVVWDSGANVWRLYFHGGSGTSLLVQSEAVALSRDGRSFTLHRAEIGPPYWSVFRTGGRWYSLVMPGTLYQSASGLRGFARGQDVLPMTARHSSAVVVNDLVLVFYSRIGDSPEHIRLRVARVSGSWRYWPSVDLGAVLMPEVEYEGGRLPVRPSSRGACVEPSRELRDPGALVFGKWLYLVYASGGERAIGLARGLLDKFVDLGDAALKEAYG